MFIYSGNCRICDVGIPTGLQDDAGDDLHTGDIVVTYTAYEETGIQYINGLTVVVGDQYRTFTDGTHFPSEGPFELYVMGLKSVNLTESDVCGVRKVKGYDHVVSGEHCPDFVFRYSAE